MRDMVVMIIPIDVTPLPIVTDARYVQSRKALSPYNIVILLSEGVNDSNNDSTYSTNRNTNRSQGYAIRKGVVIL